MKWLKEYYKRYKQARKWGVKISEITFIDIAANRPEDFNGTPMEFRRFHPVIKSHRWYGMGEPPVKNPVAKFARKFNRATVQKDRKKDSKRGYTKHKRRNPDG